MAWKPESHGLQAPQNHLFLRWWTRPKWPLSLRHRVSTPSLVRRTSGVEGCITGLFRYRSTCTGAPRAMVAAGPRRGAARASDPVLLSTGAGASRKLAWMIPL